MERTSATTTPTRTAPIKMPGAPDPLFWKKEQNRFEKEREITITIIFCFDATTLQFDFGLCVQSQRHAQEAGRSRRRRRLPSGECHVAARILASLRCIGRIPNFFFKKRKKIQFWIGLCFEIGLTLDLDQARGPTGEALLERGIWCAKRVHQAIVREGKHEFFLFFLKKNNKNAINIIQELLCLNEKLL